MPDLVVIIIAASLLASVAAYWRATWFHLRMVEIDPLADSLVGCVFRKLFKRRAK